MSLDRSLVSTSGWRRIGIAGLFVVTAIVAVALGRFDVLGGPFQPEDCGVADQFCPDVIADRLEAVENCDDLDALLVDQLRHNRYYAFDPYGRELTWHEVAGRLAEQLECPASYQ